MKSVNPVHLTAKEESLLDLKIQAMVSSKGVIQDGGGFSKLIFKPNVFGREKESGYKISQMFISKCRISHFSRSFFKSNFSSTSKNFPEICKVSMARKYLRISLPVLWPGAGS